MKQMDIEKDTTLRAQERILRATYKSGRVEDTKYKEKKGGGRPKRIDDLLKKYQALPTVVNVRII